MSKNAVTRLDRERIKREKRLAKLERRHRGGKNRPPGPRQPNGVLNGEKTKEPR